MTTGANISTTRQTAIPAPTADRTIATANKYGVSYRLAGFINAIKKIETTYRDAGLTMA